MEEYQSTDDTDITDQEMTAPVSQHAHNRCAANLRRVLADSLTSTLCAVVSRAY